MKASTAVYMQLSKQKWGNRSLSFAYAPLLGLVLLFAVPAKAQINFYDFKKEIDKLKSDRKVEKYWRALYRDDRDNVRLKVPMDSMFLLNRLKAAYLIQQYGFPDPKRFGKQSHFTFLSILTNNSFSDLNTQTFAQVLPGNKLRLWGSRYPNALMVNALFWYNGIEIALDQEFALALRKLESRSADSIQMEKLCKKASELLYMTHSADTRSLGKWTMNYRELEIPLEIFRVKNRFYLKKGKYYFELLMKTPHIYAFAEELDETTLYIFENGELVLRDRYEREMGVFPVALGRIEKTQ